MAGRRGITATRETTTWYDPEAGTEGASKKPMAAATGAVGTVASGTCDGVDAPDLETANAVAVIAIANGYGEGGGIGRGRVHCSCGGAAVRYGTGHSED